MRFLWISAAKDIKRRLADWPGLAIWLGVPVLMGALMALAFGGSGAAPKPRVLLADEDQSVVGRLVAGAASGGAGYLDIEPVAAGEGRRRMDTGEASALLILPDGLTEAVLDDTPATVTLVTNPAQRIMPEIVRMGVEMLVEIVFYLQQILGAPLKAFLQTPQDERGFFEDAVVSAFSGEFNQRLRALQPVLLPPVLSLETISDRPAAAASAGIAGMLVPGVLFMSLLFVGRAFSDDLWEERQAGTLRRAVVVPPGAWPWLAGKLAAGAIFMAAISLAGLVVTIPAAGTPLARLPGALAWCTFTGTALVAFFTVLQFLASTARGANIVTTMVLFPLMMAGGSIFPFELMPRWISIVGRLTPNGQGVAQLTALLRGQVDPVALTVAALAIGVPATACFVLSARLVRGRFAAGA